MNTPKTFWDRVEKSDGCWTWVGSINSSNGYGRVYMGKDAQPLLDYAHRVAYRDAVGPIPKGMHIDHICFNRRCVRPDHLRLATPKQNTEHRRGAQVNSKTGLRGVVKRGNVFRAVIMHNGEYIHLGYFATADEASAAHNAAAERLFTHHHRSAA